MTKMNRFVYDTENIVLLRFSILHDTLYIGNLHVSSTVMSYVSLNLKSQHHFIRLECNFVVH